MSSIGKLTYFPVMAKGLPLTCVLESSGAKYDGGFCDNWETLKASGVTPFGQLPIFEADGIVIGQCVAIVGHIGRKTGTGGSTEGEKILSDMLLAEAEDIYGLLQKNVDTAFVKDKPASDFWTGDGRGTLNSHLVNLEKLVKSGNSFTEAGNALAGEAYLFGMFYQMSLCKADFIDAGKYPKLASWYTTHLESAAMQKVITGDTPMGKFTQYFM